ncbi:MAG: hypothetical protein HYS44_03990 [Candidatus Niyogibacteria bacterium]|nr:hypothetical protein [Candidatus Niyogibacteria bacterium]
MMVQALEPREERILDYIVRLYVRRAEPVASSDVRRGLRLKESPATVRNILAELDEDGFLDQPYTSAGRIPTDQAYRYFVDYIIPQQSFLRVSQSASARVGALAHQRQTAILKRDCEGIRELADALGMLAIAMEDDDTDAYGLSHLLSQPEFREQAAVQRIAHLVDHAEEVFGAYRDTGERVFIGQENPVREAEDCSVFYISDGSGSARHEVLLVGPTRVNYEEVSAFIRNFFKP